MQVYVESCCFEKLRGKPNYAAKGRRRRGARENVHNLSIDCLSRIRLVYSRPVSSGSAQGKVESDWALERRSRETTGQTDGSGPNVPSFVRSLPKRLSAGYRASLVTHEPT